MKQDIEYNFRYRKTPISDREANGRFFMKTGIYPYEFKNAQNHLKYRFLNETFGVFDYDEKYYEIYGTHCLPNYNMIKLCFNELVKNNYKFVTEKSLYTFLAACIYYGDMSERAGYITNFMTDLENNKRKIYQFQTEGEIIKYMNNPYIAGTFPCYLQLFGIFQTIYKYNDIKLVIGDNVDIESLLSLIDGFNFKLSTKDIKQPKHISSLQEIYDLYQRAIAKWIKNSSKIIKDILKNK